MKTLTKKSQVACCPKTEKSAQCCAKSSRIPTGCHD